MRIRTVVLLAVVLVPAQGVSQTCTPDAATLCLDGNRFQIDVAWMDASAASGDGFAVAVTDDWGYFWYTDPRYVDASVRVLDGCAFNSRFWVFGNLLSDFEQTLAVTDTVPDVVKTYVNPLGAIPPAITDTDAFATCGASPAPRMPESAKTSPAPLELAGHFEITVDWRDFAGSTGNGTGVPLTSHSGYFWFFSPDNVEMIIKLVDDYADSGNFWVVFGATTNIEFTVTVTNTEDGQIRGYFNPLGNTPATLIHRDAFVSSTVFADSFESGTVTAWSNSVP